MTPELWQKVQPALEYAKQLDAAACQAYLQKLHHDHPEVAGHVESLLKHGGALEKVEAKIAKAKQVWEEQACSQGNGQASAEWPALIGPYIVGKAVGQGGMGVVLRAQDPNFPRDLAVKLLLKRHADNQDLLLRFEEEADLMGLLEHPGIPRVHARGRIADGRPYLVMKLVRGQTLQELLDGRGPARDVPRFLAIFQQVCQILAYAHSRSIIYRDLKPANVMVGAFGEVQVMDWGLAKLLPKQPAEEGKPDAATAAEGSAAKYDSIINESWLNQLHDTDSVSHTEAGTLMGTLGYMPPEQARAEIDQLDERADVFSLGSLLCAILTGQPAFRGKPADMYRQTREGNLSDAFARLDACGEDAALIALAKKCLAPNKEERPAHAGEVAEAVAQYEAKVQRRQAQIAKLRWQLALAVVVLLASIAGVVGTSWALFQVNRSRHEALAAQQAEKDRAEGEREAKLEAQAAAERANKAKRDSDNLLYSARIAQAQHAFERNQLGVTLTLLDQQRPAQADGLDRRGWEWHHLMRLCHSDLLTLRGHTAPVRSVAYSPDGTILASAGDDLAIRLWDANDGRSLATHEFHRRPVRRLAFSSDGKRLASASDDGTVALWDVAADKQLFTWKGHILPVHDVAFSPNSQMLASAGEDTTIQVWSADKKAKRFVLQGHESAINRVVFSADGRHLISAADDRTVRLWNVAAKARGEILTKTTANVKCLAVSSDGRWLALGDTDAVVHLWDMKARRQVWTSDPQRSIIADLSFSPDGKSLVTGSMDSVLQIWDVETGQKVHVLRGHLDAVHQVQYSPDGKRLASASADLTVRLWHAGKKQEATLFEGHTLRVSTAAVSPDGKYLATAGVSQSINLWDAATAQLVRTFGKHRFLRAPGKDGKPGPIRAIDTYAGHGSTVAAVAFSPKGDILASAGYDSKVFLWDIAAGKQLKELPHRSAVSSVAFSADGKFVAAGSWDNLVRIWDVATGKRQHLFKGHTHNVSSVAFSPDSQHLASASWDKTVKIWDVKRGAAVRTLRGHTGPIDSIAWSADGQWIASAGRDRFVTVWQAKSGTAFHQLFGHTTAIKGVAFSPDSKRLASTGAGRDVEEVKTWDTVTGQELLTLNGAGQCVVFSPDGKRLVGGSRNGQVLIWESSPLDDDRRRLATHEQPKVKMPAGSDPGDMRILGHVLTDQLIVGFGSLDGKVLKPGPDREFLVVVLSLPYKSFQLSPAEYQLLVDKAKADPNQEPPPAHASLADFDPRRFQLSLAGGEARAAELIGQWPHCMRTHTIGFAFAPRRVRFSRTEPIDPNTRIALALAWRIQRGAAAAPFTVHVDNDKPIAVPKIVLSAGQE